MKENDMTKNDEQQENPNENIHILHFVGTRLYSPAEFRDEAKRLGVNRTFPPWLLRNAGVNFGDNILLGDWKREPSMNPNSMTKVGHARIWGRYVVTSVNFDASQRLRHRLNELLNLQKPNEKIVEQPKRVQRKCGEYILSASRETTIPLPDIIDAWETAQIDTGEKGKMFLAGSYEDIEPEVHISKPIGFSRAGVYVKFLRTSLGDYAFPTSIGFMERYSQVKYIKKKGSPSPEPSTPSQKGE